MIIEYCQWLFIEFIVLTWIISNGCQLGCTLTTDDRDPFSAYYALGGNNCTLFERWSQGWKSGHLAFVYW